MLKTSVVIVNEVGQVTDAKLYDDDLKVRVGEFWTQVSKERFDIEQVPLSNATVILIRHKIKDALTGARNRADFERDITALFPQKKNFALAMCDVNQLKMINDKHGHQAGDKILRSLVGTLINNLRKDDTVYRYGGDEFVIIFSAVRHVEHLDVIEARLSTLLHQISAIGLAHCSEVKSASELISLADKRMYENKSDC